MAVFHKVDEIWEEFRRQEREEEEEVGGTDSEPEDLEEASEHATESEQEGSDSEIEYSQGNYFLSKDTSIKWKKDIPAKTVRTRKHNIITHLPGRKAYSKSVETVLDSFSILFDDNILNLILNSTNVYIDLLKNKFARERDAKNTTREELLAFLGLLYLAGLHKAAHVNYSDLWEDIEIFSLTMSSKRFLFLLRVIRFDDIHSRETRRKLDKLAPVRDFITIINNNFKNAFSPSEYCTIDEQLIPFRGKCPFRQYLPKKPKRYGIKVFALVDARMHYLVNFEIYVGTQPEGPFRQPNTVLSIVNRLIEPVEGTNRNITCDNWYTSYQLAQQLKQKKLTIVGTLRKNKREIPSEFQPNKHKKIYSSLFGFTEDATLVSYVTAKNKAVILLSTMHHDATIDTSTGPKAKPEVITFYNGTKGGVDMCDQMCANFNVGRRTRRWPLAIFFHFLNVTGINAHLLYNIGMKNNYLVRRKFLRSLGESLVERHIKMRQLQEHIPKPLKKKIKLHLGEEIKPSIQIADGPGPSRGRCKLCPRKDDKKPSQKCTSCKNFICKGHSMIVCAECFQDTN